MTALSHVPPTKPTRYLQSGLPIGPPSVLSPLSKLALFQSTLTLLSLPEHTVLLVGALLHARSDELETDEGDVSCAKRGVEMGSRATGMLEGLSYREVKELAGEYQVRKRVLRGEEGSVWPEWKGKAKAKAKEGGGEERERLEGFGRDGKAVAPHSPTPPPLARNGRRLVIA
jgi:hypothetical protein